MLAALGFDSLDALIDAAVPRAIREREPLAFGDAAAARPRCSPSCASSRQRNEVFTSLIGLGYHDTITPPVILRNVLENPAWYTAYTPYQPEISQGRLEALLNFQTMVADLTGMELANASLLDEGTAAAEAMAMLHRLNPKAGDAFFVDADCHPQTIEVVRTRAEPLGIEVVVGDPDADVPSEGVLRRAAAVPGEQRRAARRPRDRSTRAHAQRRARRGRRRPARAHAPRCRPARSAPTSWSARRSASACRSASAVRTPRSSRPATSTSARCRAGSSACRSTREGRTAYRLALQTREQHIRREKATSNICTAQVLLAVIAGLVRRRTTGPKACARSPTACTGSTVALAASLRARRRRGRARRVLRHDHRARARARGRRVAAAARSRRINLRVVDADTLGIALDETTTDAIVASVCAAFGVAVVDDDDATDATRSRRRCGARREFLTHPAFHRYRSEHQMLRYLRRLADRDLALDRTMIPLGSCTMKLNATAEMVPITWPEFGRIHPFAPIDQAQGYLQLFDDLERWLAEITGYDAVSLQPNAGSQGEYAGLLAIRTLPRSHAASPSATCA